MLEVGKVSEQEEEKIYKKKLKISDVSETYHVRYYCKKCRSQLMWTTEFYDVASSTIHETADCKHYEWVTTWCNPLRFDPEKWECRLAEPWIKEIKDRVVFVYRGMSEYYVLLKKPKE